MLLLVVGFFYCLENSGKGFLFLKLSWILFMTEKVLPFFIIVVTLFFI